MSPFLLEGQVDNRDQVIVDLTEKLRSAQEENRRLTVELAQLRAANSKAIARLRHVMDPLWGALQVIYGEIESIPVEPDIAVSDPRRRAVWEMWKEKLGGLPARFIDALLVAGPMTQTQLRIAVGCAQGSVAGAVCQLNKAGIIEKRDGKVSLRQV